jgi:hypothetical protein
MKKAGVEQEKKNKIKGSQIKRITLKGVKISREGLENFFLPGAGAPASPSASAIGKRMYFRLINGLNPRPLVVMRYWYLTVNST